MDKRVKKPVSPDVAALRREQFYADIADGSLTIAESVVAMRKISRLTQVEFARHRGISVQSLKQIEAGTANPTVETLQKISAIFGLEIGFVPKVKVSHLATESEISHNFVYKEKDEA